MSTNEPPTRFNGSTDAMLASTPAQTLRVERLSELTSYVCMVNFVDFEKIQQRSADADGCC